MEITVLDLPDKVNKLLNDNAEAIRQAVAEDEQTNSKLKQSKVIAPIVMAIRKEIQDQGAIYTDEENKAVKFVTILHQNTKASAEEAERLAKELKKEWDDKKAARIGTICGVLRESVDKAKDLKGKMTGHQKFRAGFCTRTVAVQLLGQRSYDELNDFYLGIREGPMREYMALHDKWQKIEEHSKRAEQFLKLLPVLKGDDRGADEVLEELREDAAKITELKDRFELDIPAKVKNLGDAYDTLKDHKRRPCTPQYMKNCAGVLRDHEIKIKTHRAELKTSAQAADGAAKKASTLGKDREAKDLVKQIERDVAAMEEQLKDWNKMYDKTEKEYDKVAKALDL